MANSCSLAPTISKREGNKIVEHKSKLFKNILDAVNKNYQTAWNLWAFTKSKNFKSKYGNNVSYDELGEVTFPSLVEALGLKDSYDNNKDIRQVTAEYGYDTRIFKNINEAVLSINSFNLKEKNFVASVHPYGEGYKIEVKVKNPISLSEAREQSFNHALSYEILNLLNEMGFTLDIVDDPKFKGLFDPSNAKLRDGLLTVIKIAKGELGEEALPEEFSHLIIEGLKNHPLVQRLLNIITDDDVINILGDQYEQYDEEYKSDEAKLKREAAGKLLAQHIVKQGTISKEIVKPKEKFLTRIWNWAKKIFSSITNSQIRKTHDDANDIIAGIYNLVSSKKVINLVDRSNILNAEKLYQLQSNLSTLELIAGEAKKVAVKANELKLGVSKNFNKEKAAKNFSSDLKEANERIKTLQSYTKEGVANASTENLKKTIVDFLYDTAARIHNIAEQQAGAKIYEDKGFNNDMQIINNVAKISRNIELLSEGYREILGGIARLQSLTDQERNSLHLGDLKEEDIKKQAEIAQGLLAELDVAEAWAASSKRNILLATARSSVYQHDALIEIGDRKKNEILSYEQILEHGEEDINLIDRWLSAMGDSSDAFLNIFEGIVKQQQYERDSAMIDYYAKIAAIDKKLRSSGNSSEFILEKKADGSYSKRLISDFDFDGYNEAYKAYRERIKKEQEERKESDAWFKKRLDDWKKEKDPKTKEYKRIKYYIKPENQKLHEEGKDSLIPEAERYDYELVPNPKVFKGKVGTIANLNSAQREYYNAMMDIKREMMSKIPRRGQHIFNAIYISKDIAESVIDNTQGNRLKALYDNFKKTHTRRPDDIGFGTTDDLRNIITDILEEFKASKDDYKEAANKAAKAILDNLVTMLDEDIVIDISEKDISNILQKHYRAYQTKEIESSRDLVTKQTNAVLDLIVSKNFYIVDTDFAGHRIQKLPIYYSRPLKDMRMISTDFTSNLLAYSAMAVNYEKMNEVIDILEVGRSLVKDRSLHVTDGGRNLVSRITSFAEVFKSQVVEPGAKSNIAARMDDYMASVVYEERKIPMSGTILGTNIDIAKTIETIKDYNGLLTMGFNLFSIGSNLLVGKLQQFIEAGAGEFFSFKTLYKAKYEYSKLIWEYLAELNEPVKKSKLSLLIQTFDPMNEVFEGMRGTRFNKNAASRLLGDGVLAYLGMNAGEHILHCETMIAILLETELKTDDGKKTNLYDALKVVKKGDIYKLEIDTDLGNTYYERDKIDYSGTTKKDRETGKVYSTNKNYGKPVKDANGKIVKEKIYIKRKNEESKEVANNLKKLLFKKKKIVRKVNNMLNGAYGVNDKGAAHRDALKSLLLQFRQWMPAHYGRRFAKAHYDTDLEMFREGYYTTVLKTMNQLKKELKKAKWDVFLAASKTSDNLTDYEKANLKRACTEVMLFTTLWFLCEVGGNVKDKNRSWFEKMYLYQLHRMYMEIGASTPINPLAMLSNLRQLLQSPVPSFNVMDKAERVLHLDKAFHEIEQGRYEGWLEIERNLFELLPLFPQGYKAWVFEDNMFSIYED